MRTMPDEEKIVLCRCCTLAQVMRDCDRCPFNIGLIHKAFEAIKASAIQAPPKLREEYLSRVKILVEDSNLNLSSL